MRIDLSSSQSICRVVHKIDGNEGKAILKKVASHHLPEKIVYRTKAGFPVPWQDYLPMVPRILDNDFVAEWTGLSGKELEQWYGGDDRLKFRLIAIEVWGRIFVFGEKPDEVKVI